MMLKKVAAKLGIDKAIFYTASARIFQAVGGVVSVFLVATFLTGVEQGFYYTFGSILAIQIFFELGLTSIITQFVAHEKAHLDDELNGNEMHRSRLAYLLHFCLKWYGVLALGVIVILSVVGFIFFEHFYHAITPVSWRVPWILLVSFTAVNFVISPISAFIEGLGYVKQIAKIRFVQQILSQVCIWGGLVVGFKLYVATFSPLVMALIFIIWGGKYFGKLLHKIYKTHITEKVSYRNEIFPYQWKIALSWVSGYFIFQLFNPVLFATEGAVVAGQMGMTLTVINSIQALSFSWINTKIPIFSSQIVQKNYATLDRLFNTTLKQMLFITIVACAVLILGVWGLRILEVKINGSLLATRFIGILPMSLLIISMITNVYVGAIALYLRCHKKEPFLINSIIAGVLCTLSTLLLGNYFGLIGITVGYCAITLLLLPYGQYLYISNKKKWHQS